MRSLCVVKLQYFFGFKTSILAFERILKKFVYYLANERIYESYAENNQKPYIIY